MKKQYIILVAIFQYIFLIAMVKCQSSSFNAPSANCRSYTCKGGKKYLAVPKGKSKYKSSGCKSNGISMFDVNQMAGRKDPVTQCCDLRTACFSICGVSYKYCEKEFKKTDHCSANQIANYRKGSRIGEGGFGSTAEHFLLVGPGFQSI